MFGLQMFPSLKKKSAYTKVGFGRVFLEGCDNVTKKRITITCNHFSPNYHNNFN